MYKDADGFIYESYLDYINSPNLDPENIYIKLLAGVRTPQNEEERRMKEEMDEILAQGLIVETFLDSY